MGDPWRVLCASTGSPIEWTSARHGFDVHRHAMRHGWGLIGIVGECCPSCLSRLSGRAGRSNFTPARQRCTVQSTNGWCIQLSLRLSVSKRGSEFDSPRILHRLWYIVPYVGRSLATQPRQRQARSTARQGTGHRNRSGQPVLSSSVKNLSFVSLSHTIGSIRWVGVFRFDPAFCQ